MSWIETSRAFDADNMGGNESNPVVLKEKHQGVTIENRSKSVTDMLLIPCLFTTKYGIFRDVFGVHPIVSLKSAKKSRFRLWK